MRISLIIFLLAFMFNYIIRPFGVNYAELKVEYYKVALIHSVVPLFVLLPLAFITYRFRDLVENWLLKKELLFIFCFLVLTGIANFLIRDIIYDNSLNWSLPYLFEEISNTLTGGILLASLIIFINLNIQFLSNTEQAQELSRTLTQKTAPIDDSRIEIETELKSESFSFFINEFIFAKADGNYIELWLSRKGVNTAELKRMKLKDLELLLGEYPQIVRTHRSYLINKDHIQNISGNAQGYKLTLKNCKIVVPVSRTYLDEFNRIIHTD